MKIQITLTFARKRYILEIMLIIFVLPEAGWGYPDALHLRVAGEVLRADALLPVPRHAALGIEATAALQGAGVSAPTLVANFVHFAISVQPAGSYSIIF